MADWDYWPHQKFAIAEVPRAFDAGYKAPVVASPTGGGKTAVVEEFLRMPWRVHLYTNRNWLREQIAEGLQQRGIGYGEIAAGSLMSPYARVQLCSTQTVHSRFIKKGKKIPVADVAIVDEAHNNSGPVMQEILSKYPKRIGITATPIGIGGVYDYLITAGKTSELRDCGALLRAITYAPDEPDARNLKTSTKTGEYTYGSLTKAIMTPTIFGRVFEHWEKLNPEMRPTLLFAPGVKESLWFAEQFVKRGIPAAHIDGEKIWVNGLEFDSTKELRKELQGMSENGSVKVVCNRFVMREGISWNHLYHGIFATAFGSLTAYIQSGGRLLRNHPSLDSVIIQDHGGSFHRHGSLNEDREWTLDCEDKKLVQERKEKLQDKKEREPIVCPKCTAVRLGGAKCPSCGFEHNSRSRMVMQKDGSLVQMRGDIYKPRKTTSDPADVKLWKACVFGSRNAGHTFRQAAGKFMRQTGRMPHESLGLVPKDPKDWYKKVGDVDWKSLSERTV